MDQYELRAAVGKWLRIRAQHEAKLEARYGHIMNHGTVEQLFLQLAADAEHSALLLRLFEGKEPLDDPPPLEYSYPVYPDDE